MKAHKIVLSLVLALSSLAIPTCAQEIAVAASADLKFAMGDVASQYEKQTGSKVNVTYGSSGNFFSQLQNGAPFDLFFSAQGCVSVVMAFKPHQAVNSVFCRKSRHHFVLMLPNSPG